MRPELIVKTRSLVGSSDLTLFAPIKPGLVPSLESVTYKTRVKRLLTLLNTGRSSSHEYSLLRPFSDAVERVGRIHSVRVAVVEAKDAVLPPDVEPVDKILLAVTFDGPWESYIRVLWQKVGALLDVIFCNTDKYVSAYDHSFEQWLEWAHRVQIETSFFYAMPAITVDDVRYLKSDESLHREHPAELVTDIESTKRSMQRVESVAWDVTVKGHIKVRPETVKLGLQSLAALYRLTDLYLPASEDGKYLHRAARELLLEFVQLLENTDLLEIPMSFVQERFEKQLSWLQKAKNAPPPHGYDPPPLPTSEEGPPAYVGNDVQGGIIDGYKGITHGCLLLVAFDTTLHASNFLSGFIREITRSDALTQPGELVRNIALTYEGLRVFGLSETQLSYFPQEFREGMEARASILGDFRINHPRRWRLPARNWPNAAADEPERIELSAVHAVVQLRVGTTNEVQLGIEELNDPKHPLYDEVKRLFTGGSGVRLLAVQAMRRYPNDLDQSVEHFGFVDGLSQPVIDPRLAGHVYRNQVHLGELLLGYPNEADTAPTEPKCMEWLRNGSFLVVRKLGQDVEALEEAVGSATPPGMTREAVLAKMMGRELDGTPLELSADKKNDFNYRFDTDGARCPFQAHIRRANPRSRPPEDVPEPPGRRTPRLMRRGMSYGPRYTKGENLDNVARAINSKERGLVFMAYNASIAEQFEIVQRWLNGGNSTGVFSGQSDPFVGVAENGQPRIFRFLNENQVVRMSMDGWNGILEAPKPIVRLEWGAYLFTPSISALVKLQETAAHAGSAPRPVWSAAEGDEHIKALEALKDDAAEVAWKSALEDPESQRTFVSASIWAAIRETRCGVLRIPYGVIVADPDLAMEVLKDDHNFSVQSVDDSDSYLKRMEGSIGGIYLGLDASNPEYAKQSTEPNIAIHAIDEEDAFKTARDATARALDQFIKDAQEQARAAENPRWELTLDLKEVLDKVLAHLCDCWFGVLETEDPKHETRFKRGGTHWDWNPDKPQYYPGNFTAPSRYIFQPKPGLSVKKIGQDYGAALRKAMSLWIADLRNAGNRPTAPGGGPAPIGEAIFKLIKTPADVDLAARTFVGVMMGFLPPADGNLRLTLNEWLRDGTFWALRAKLPGRSIATYADAMSLIGKSLCQAMQLRPSPELVWRTVARHHTLRQGTTHEVVLKPGETVIVSIVSATQQCLAQDKSDLFPIFGGARSGKHPTHACPGYKAAMGVIVGVLAGLLEVKEAVRPSIGPVALVLEGPTPPLQEPTPQARMEISLRRKRISRQLRKPAPRPGVITRTLNRVLGRSTTMELLAWGDSWLHYNESSGDTTNIANYLRGLQYKFTIPPFGNDGLWLEKMAEENNLKDFTNTLDQMLAVNNAPRAILLSGGGNDVVKKNLLPLLVPASANTDPIIESAIKAQIDKKLGAYYVAILTAITKVCGDYKVHVPVLLHPYDHPIPDGRLVDWYSGSMWSWLYPYITTDKKYDLDAGIKIMRRIIDRFHTMQTDLIKQFPDVIVVNTPGTLDPYLSNYKDYWENELHPRSVGFAQIGKKFANILNGL
ncbi:MAG: Dyp-type peroxidase [Betaproteobacteria bacterium]|nr:Dyp-type peroxidase [Betaproteobacteria bacterium]